MIRFSQSSLLLGVAVLALGACGGGKGPGALGSKNDIVVRNNGLPGATAPVPPSAAGEITSTIEQGEAVPTPAVAGEPLAMPPENEPLVSADPAADTVALQSNEASAPAPSSTAAPLVDGTSASTAPAADIAPYEPMAAAPAGTRVDGNLIVPNDAPASAVTALGATKIADVQSAAHPQAQMPATETFVPPAGVAMAQKETAAVPASPSSVYPAEDYPSEYAAPVQQQASVSAPIGTPVAHAPTPSIDFTDPVIVKSVQAALKLKGAYKGKEDGVVNTQYLNALSKYQAENKLSQGGLNIDTLRSLGIVQ